MIFRVVILGGTAEARQLASKLSGDPRFNVTVSLAGVTARPSPHAVPVRTGGFGGPDGLARYLHDHRIDVLVDATHPFAVQISENAMKAAARSRTSLIVVRRPPWIAQPADRWRLHRDAAAVIDALGMKPRRVFVTLGRQHLAALLSAPHHCYLVRSVDPVDPPLALPNISHLLDRGPFEIDREEALLVKHAIDAIVTRNSGGPASAAKLQAARKLGIAVEMIERPMVVGPADAGSVSEAVGKLDQLAVSLVKRGE